MHSSDLTVAATFHSVAEAQIAKGMLDAAGIQCMIRSDNAGGMYPSLAGAEILVRTEDAERAEQALQHDA